MHLARWEWRRPITSSSGVEGRDVAQEGPCGPFVVTTAGRDTRQKVVAKIGQESQIGVMVYPGGRRGEAGVRSKKRERSIC